jgi:hypothetical protein
VKGVCSSPTWRSSGPNMGLPATLTVYDVFRSAAQGGVRSGSSIDPGGVGWWQAKLLKKIGLPAGSSLPTSLLPLELSGPMVLPPVIPPALLAKTKSSSGTGDLKGASKGQKQFLKELNKIAGRKEKLMLEVGGSPAAISLPPDCVS